MKAAVLLALAGALGTGTVALAQERAPVPREAPAPAAGLEAPAGTSARPSAETIRAAIRETLAERPAIPRLHEADTLRASQYETFARQVEEATVPDCLHPDGLKRQPTFFIAGIYALPFVAVAKLRGVCR